MGNAEYMGEKKWMSSYKSHFPLFSWVLIGLVCLTCVQGTIYYASPQEQTPGNSCTSPSSPCSGLIAALQKAQGNYDTIVLMEGTYSGSLNVPFQVDQFSITLQGSGPGEVFIDCGHIYPYCAQIFISHNVVMENLNFINYRPYTPDQIAELPLSASNEGPFQSLLSVQSQFNNDISFDWPPPRYNLQLLNCEFSSNLAPTATGDRNWIGASLIYSYKLFPNTWLDLVNVTFSHNTVSAINSMYSNLNITGAKFTDNSASGLPMAIQATIHPWFGGAQVVVKDSQFDGSETDFSHMIILDGTFCNFNSYRGESQCLPFEFSGNVFNGKGGPPIMSLVNGAQLFATSNKFYLGANQPGIVTETGVTHLGAPCQLSMSECEFSSTEIGAIAIYGYFTDTTIDFSLFDNVTALYATGELSMSNCQFSNSNEFIAFAQGSFYISFSSFQGVEGACFQTDVGGVLTNDTVTSTVVMFGNEFLDCTVEVNSTSFMYFSANSFSYSSQWASSVISCLAQEVIDSALNFVGEANSFPSGVDIVNADSTCMFICGDSNKDICKDDNVNEVVLRSTLNGLQISLIIIFCLTVVWAVVVSIILFIILLKVRNSRTQADSDVYETL